MRRLWQLKALKSNKGFSLLEMAAVLVIAGLIITPAISLYHQNQIEEDWEETEDHIDAVLSALGGFRAIYGRYPCPAEMTAVPGDNEYGHESDCNATPGAGNCADGICETDSALLGKTVIHGSIPFKTLNLLENQSYDKYSNRLSYAVTKEMASAGTFSLSGGGITVRDKVGNDLVDPPNSAHFVLVSHGQNQSGGITKAGLEKILCSSSTAEEEENCDDDSEFISGEVDDIYDDRTDFFSAVNLSEWQRSESVGFEETIHLKNTDSIAVGASANANLNGASQTDVKSISSDSGGVRAEQDFHLERICSYGATTDGECFTPGLIAGQLTSVDVGSETRYEKRGDEGISCYDDTLNPATGNKRYLVAIEDGQAICSEEIYLSCPNNDVITGINSDGEVICANPPAPSCEQLEVVNSCGDTVTIGEDPRTLSGDTYSVYSGECRMITNYNAAHFEAALAGMTKAQIYKYIKDLNKEDRTIVDCGPDEDDSLIRDTYQCNAANWSLRTTHEIGSPWSSARFPSNPLSTGGSQKAETNNNNQADPNNNKYDHDCWCREDYKVYTQSCPGGLSGERYVVQKHKCPQTYHNWQTIYTQAEQCSCVPGSETETRSCNAYYDEVNGTSGTNGLTGTVELTYNTTCQDDVLVQDEDPVSVDTSDCACASNSDIIRRVSCPEGTGNSWSWSGGNETNVKELYVQEWSCPGTTSGGLPDPGSLSSEVAQTGIPSCSCEVQTEIVTKACPSDKSGTGVKWERRSICPMTSGTVEWEPEDQWTLIDDDCYSCAWQPPAGSPSLEDYPYGSEKGGTCACGSPAAAQCYDYASGGKYDVWSGCQCVGQVD